MGRFFIAKFGKLIHDKYNSLRSFTTNKESAMKPFIISFMLMIFFATISIFTASYMPYFSPRWLSSLVTLTSGGIMVVFGCLTFLFFARILYKKDGN
ncbi:MAG: hypothetical protein A3C58_00160 [Candidatus Staskawiczbacteria bacterium RIFCSPHIGHO2_02_FULL_34_10]|uniref:Uncharacterized protein n=2 Tax=Candidatus Staskawicziibacteriota TaxID=1817916 RepID=A0A1G2HLC3_9BACT|nr:MAG: hypothetical protein A2639_02490 [Candidatus Staskawiczbacteria bacterium RIFCSPHIGHO2_01_FULL_34_27]OGZ67195.1 MAG: hypothetical protein A3C58_00160 [Candidatus Staskawiczbacteria bacterium RIFCSPHIGHO2_02_FULL_34_10]